jgi:hypothetical protein
MFCRARDLQAPAAATTSVLGLRLMAQMAAHQEAAYEHVCLMFCGAHDIEAPAAATTNALGLRLMAQMAAHQEAAYEHLCR